jgi:hypothetical protein
MTGPGWWPIKRFEPNERRARLWINITLDASMSDGGEIEGGFPPIYTQIGQAQDYPEVEFLLLGSP